MCNRSVVDRNGVAKTLAVVDYVWEMTTKKSSKCVEHGFLRYCSSCFVCLCVRSCLFGVFGFFVFCLFFC